VNSSLFAENLILKSKDALQGSVKDGTDLHALAVQECLAFAELTLRVINRNCGDTRVPGFEEVLFWEQVIENIKKRERR
jgi:hypothetical protein